MRAVIQRVKKAEVHVGERLVGAIGAGMLVLLGIGKEDSTTTAVAMADKIAHLRIFDDDQGHMNRPLVDVGGAVLCVSQFTLYGDCRKGRRPSYDRAAQPELAKRIYEAFVEALKAQRVPVETGQFQALMEVELVNDGPVTLLLDSDRVF
jgi:D-tyrosyl-tRNA(Tyr) deacylase